MHEFDPALLRRLAVRYRARAQTEPGKAILFCEIARDMEARAVEVEANLRTELAPSLHV